MNISVQQAIFAITITVLVSYSYFAILNRIEAKKKERTNFKKVPFYLAQKIIGFVLLGIIPALTGLIFFEIKPMQITMPLANTGHLWIWMIIVSIILILLNFHTAKRPDLQASYPELRLRQWNTKTFAIAGAGWLIYLTGYEFLFRGILLSTCVTAFGIWPAITINIALYSSLHLYKGLKEATAAIPFGALLCYLTIASSSIYPAILIHAVQSISAEIACIYRNNEMTFKFNKYISS